MKKGILYRIVMFVFIISMVFMMPLTMQAATKKSVTIKTKIATSSSTYTGNSITIGTSTNVKSTITYKSSNTKIATVTSKGVIKAVKAGTVKITITAKPKSTKYYKTTTKTLTINIRDKKSVTINTKLASSSSAYVGNSATVGATTNVSSTVTYKSSNTKVATVSAKGVVKAVTAGTVKITVTAVPKSTNEYKTTTKTLTIRVIKKKETYKVVYHYSYTTSTKTVTKTVTVGTKPTLYSASTLGFTNSSHIFIGWNAYLKSSKKWKLYNSSLTGSVWGSYSSSKLYTFEAGGSFTDTIKKGDELHLYGQWVNMNGINVSLAYFQSKNTTKSSGLVDSTTAIQTALNLASKTSNVITVKIPKGTYYISNALHVYSNTKLVCDSNTTIRRTVTTKKYMIYVGNSSSGSGGYAQAKNVTIQGGTWIANPRTSNNLHTAMYFAHTQNVTVKNLTIENYSGKHALVFAAVKNGTVDNVTIEDFVEDTTTGKWLANAIAAGTVENVKSHAEAIHVDNATKEGEPDAPPCDSTLSTGIVVKNCVLDDVLCGIGSHVKNDVVGGTISILNNEFHDVKYRCLNIYNKASVTISGNKVYLFSTYMYSYNSTIDVNDEVVSYSITDTDKTSMRTLYLQVIKNIKSYTFPTAGSVSTYQYFLQDINNDGIRELIVGAVYKGADKKTYHDCLIFTCRKSSGSYTLKKLYGNFTAQTLYIASDANALYIRNADSATSTTTITRITITANTIISKQISTFSTSSTAETSFTNSNQKVTWISTSNLTALSAALTE